MMLSPSVALLHCLYFHDLHPLFLSKSEKTSAECYSYFNKVDITLNKTLSDSLAAKLSMAKDLKSHGLEVI